MAIAEGDADRIAADGIRGTRGGLGFEHRQNSRGGRRGAGQCKRLFLCALVVACGAGAFFAQECEIVVAAVAVGPGDVDSRAGRDVDFYGGRFFADINGSGHG